MTFRKAFLRFGVWAALCLGLAAVAGSGPSAQIPGGSEAPFVDGEILVRFKPSAGAASRTTAIAAEGASLIQRFGTVDVYHLRLPRGSDVLARVRALQRHADVLSVQPNYIRHVTGPAPPNDPFWTSGQLWGMEKIQAQPAWNGFGTGSSSVVVAVLDTGVNYNHPDLAPNIWTNPGEIPANGVDDDKNGYVDDVHGINASVTPATGNPMDDHGHGTHVTGTIGGRGNNGIGVVGVNWDVKVIGCKFLNAGGVGSDAGAIRCFNYLLDLKLNRQVNIRVTNNSWGAQRGPGAEPNAALKQVIDAAGAAGILNVFAAGNDSLNVEQSPHDPASFDSPSIVSVAASDAMDNPAAFSNYGSTSVDLAAPGVGIISTFGSGYGSASGTSMAAPHVAGAAALIFSEQPALPVSAVKALLMTHVDTLPQWAGKVVSGGRLNLHTAMLFAGNTPPAVNVTQPLPGATFQAPASIALSASASDSDGTVSRVDFFAGTAPVGSDTTAPYSVVWSGVSPGTYSITAVATDGGGAFTTSDPVTITVNGPGGAPPQSLLTTQTPAFGNVIDNVDYEMGMRFSSDVAGQITAVRFWKAPNETGSHVGRIWSASGQLLASVTFTSESGSGWQQQALAAPLTIAAQAIYTVSVNTGNRSYVATWDTFLSPLTSGDLGAPAGANGVFAAGAPGTFPTASYRSTNYFRDVVFVAGTPPPDTTPPTVAVTAPADGSTVSGMVAVSATAGDNVAVAGVQFKVDGQPVGAEDTSAPYDVTWNSGAAGNGLHTVSATARDAAGNTTSASVSVTVSNDSSTPQTLLTSQTPAFGNLTDYLEYELGMRLFSDVAGQITAVRFWKAPSETGTHVGRVWSANGQLLASVMFTGESASGWQQQALAAPLAVTAQTIYTVSVNTTNRSYVATWDTFASPLTNGNLHAPAGVNGVFAQGAPGTFPTSSYRSTNYFRDVVFVAGAAPPDTTPPTVSITAPADGSTVSGTVTLSATASDDVAVTGVQFAVDGAPVEGEDTSAPYSVTWNSVAVANGSHTVSATARDAAGKATTATVTVTVANDASAPQTLLTSQTPAFGNVIDNVDYEMGMKFYSDVAGQITAVRFWKAPNDTGTHVGRIWNANGQLLATVTFTGETASGWQQQALPAPLAIAPQAVYTVSVNTTNRSYVATWDTFATPVSNGHLYAPAGSNGVFAQGLPGTFPTVSYRSTNYFRDVVFVPQ